MLKPTATEEPAVDKAKGEEPAVDKAKGELHSLTDYDYYEASYESRGSYEANDERRKLAYLINVDSDNFCRRGKAWRGERGFNNGIADTDEGEARRARHHQRHRGHR